MAHIGRPTLADPRTRTRRHVRADTRAYILTSAPEMRAAVWIGSVLEQQCRYSRTVVVRRKVQRSLAATDSADVAAAHAPL